MELDASIADEAYKLASAEQNSFTRLAALSALVLVLIAFVSIAVNLQLLDSGTIKLGFAEFTIGSSIWIRILLLIAAIYGFCFTLMMASVGMLSGSSHVYATLGSKLAQYKIQEIEVARENSKLLSRAFVASAMFMFAGPVLVILATVMSFIYSFFLPVQ